MFIQSITINADLVLVCASCPLINGATAGDDRKMNNEPLEREPIDRMRLAWKRYSGQTPLLRSRKIVEWPTP
jgi:hypothetical protein